MVIFISTALFFDFNNGTFNKSQELSTSKEKSDVCNGVKVKFKKQEVEQSLVQDILKKTGAVEGDYKLQNGFLFIPLKDKCDKLSAILAASSLRNMPEIEYVTPVFLYP